MIQGSVSPYSPAPAMASSSAMASKVLYFGNGMPAMATGASGTPIASNFGSMVLPGQHSGCGCGPLDGLKDMISGLVNRLVSSLIDRLSQSLGSIVDRLPFGGDGAAGGQPSGEQQGGGFMDSLLGAAGSIFGGMFGGPVGGMLGGTVGSGLGKVASGIGKAIKSIF